MILDVIPSLKLKLGRPYGISHSVSMEDGLVFERAMTLRNRCTMYLNLYSHRADESCNAYWMMAQSVEPTEPSPSRMVIRNQPCHPIGNIWLPFPSRTSILDHEIRRDDVSSIVGTSTIRILWRAESDPVCALNTHVHSI